MFWCLENSVCVLDAPQHTMFVQTHFLITSSSALTSQVNNGAILLTSAISSRAKENHSKSFPWVFNWLMVPSMLRATVHAKRLIILNKFIFSRHNSMPTAIQLPNGPWFSCLANKCTICKWPQSGFISTLQFCEEILLEAGMRVKACWFHRPWLSYAAWLCWVGLLGWQWYVLMAPESLHKQTASSSDSLPSKCSECIFPPFLVLKWVCTNNVGVKFSTKTRLAAYQVLVSGLCKCHLISGTRTQLYHCRERQP